MKQKHAALLDFQKKLIVSANPQPRIDALNIFRIVAENLDEFISLRLPEEPRDEDGMINLTDAMEHVVDVYRDWATAILRRFPMLSNFKSIHYAGKKYAIRTVCDQPEPTRYLERTLDTYTVRDEKFIDAIEHACETAEVSPKAITVVHCWNEDGANDEDCFPENELLVVTPLFEGENQVVYAFYWRYNFLVNFADPSIFNSILSYLDCDKYSTVKFQATYEYSWAGNQCMVLPVEALSDDFNPELICRTPFYTEGDNEDELRHLTPLEVLDYRQNLDEAEEIWMTVYRTDCEPGQVYHDFLINMANTLHEKFHVYIEMMSRGDTRNNLAIYRELKAAGADVACKPAYHKISNFKVHAKVMVVRGKNPYCKDEDSDYWKWTRMLSTGNFVTTASEQFRDTFYTRAVYTGKDHPFLFNAFPKTAMLFNDILHNIFAEGEGYQHQDIINKEDDVQYSMSSFIEIFNRLIDDAIDSAYDDNYPFLWIKVNNITHVPIINKLLDAVRAGVMVEIITRSGCSIPTGISYPNLKIRTIAGKYLEHDRFFIYGNYDHYPLDADPSAFDVDKAYIMSSDLMERNMTNRVEFMCELPTYEATAVTMLFDRIARCDSDAQYGFFNFSLTPSCWDYPDFVYDEFMPFVYDKGHVFHIREKNPIEDTPMDGDGRFEQALYKVLADYGKGSTDMSALMQFLSGEKKAQVNTLMTPKELSAAVDSVHKARICKYMREAGITDPAYIEFAISKIMEMPEHQRAMYIDQFKIMAQSSIGMPKAPSGGFNLPPLKPEECVPQEPVIKSEFMSDGIKTSNVRKIYATVDSTPKFKGGKLIDMESKQPLSKDESALVLRFNRAITFPYTKLANLQRRKGIDGTDFRKILMSYQDTIMSTTHIDLHHVEEMVDAYLTLHPEMKKEEGKLENVEEIILEFWDKFIGDPNELGDFRQANGITERHTFDQIIYGNRFNIKDVDWIELDDVKEWIQKYMAYDFRLADKFWALIPNDSSSGQALMMLDMHRISEDSFFRILERYRTFIESAYERKSSISILTLSGWISIFQQDPDSFPAIGTQPTAKSDDFCTEFFLRLGITNDEFAILIEKKGVTYEQLEEILSIHADEIRKGGSEVSTYENLEKWIDEFIRTHSHSAQP